TFKQEAATEIRRLFIGPLLPGRVLRRDWLRLLPFPRGLRTQAVDSHDVGRAYRLAALGDVRGAFNVAAPPVLDASLLAAALGGRSVELPAGAIRAAAWATWKARLQPTSPGWLDMGMLSPIMDTARAQRELGWNATCAPTRPSCRCSMACAAAPERARHRWTRDRAGRCAGGSSARAWAHATSRRFAVGAQGNLENLWTSARNERRRTASRLNTRPCGLACRPTTRRDHE